MTKAFLTADAVMECLIPISRSSFVEPTVYHSLNNGRVSSVSEPGSSEPPSRAAKRAATAQRILDAARAEFGERGLESATIRRIAQRANVDPSLIMQHYGSKAALFAVAIQLEETTPGEIEDHLHDVLDVRLGELPPETRALVRSMLTAPEAAASMSAFLNERVANLSRAMGGEDADLRAALIVSSILGLTVARHFLKLDAFAGVSDAEIARVARPWVTTGVDPASG
jgi:AcrR family transcriptional regulator